MVEVGRSFNGGLWTFKIHCKCAIYCVQAVLWAVGWELIVGLGWLAKEARLLLSSNVADHWIASDPTAWG
ncbi:hypothetical protein V6N12_007404 [Hibiscus sabdariffa]|uniref:Uncharacterized protein n=1 Tax=Hibiscus sabdariffa TaxID=183260 RepID=A0ABR2F1Q4_9ROSI